MFIVGLTGGIASGKTTVSKIFEDHGITVVCGDKIARDVVEPGKSAWKQIREQFGPEYFLESGEIDRPKLGTLIFSDSAARTKLNKITHPEIYKEMVKRCFAAFFCGEHFIVLDLPLLFESKFCLKFVNTIIVVFCSEDQQAQRLVNRNEYTLENARLRIQSQYPLSEKCKLAHIIIDNSGSQDSLKQQVEGVIANLRKSKAHWKLRGALLVVISTFLYLGIRNFLR